MSDPEVLHLAKNLLGQTLSFNGISLMITEVEAYNGSEDQASHAFKRTKRSEIMFGPNYRAYVYQIHTHHCLNIVTGPRAQGAAVLLRAGVITAGLEKALRNHSVVKSEVKFASGPGNLARSLGVNIADKGKPVIQLKTPLSGQQLLPVPYRQDFAQGEVFLLKARTTSAFDISCGPRVGVRFAAMQPWRFWISGHPSVSKYKRHPKADHMSHQKHPG